MVDFEFPDEASLASSIMEGETVFGRRVHCRLESDRPHEQAGGILQIKTSTVQVDWFAPSCFAFAHYSTKNDAVQHARRLNGLMYQGSAVSATFQPPKARHITLFTVYLRGLPHTATEESLKEFTAAQTLDLKNLNFNQQDAERLMKEFVNDISPVTSFRMLRRNNGDPKYKAIIKFSDHEAASAVVRILEDSTLEFIGSRKPFPTLLYNARFHMLLGQHNVIKDQLLSLQKQIHQEHRNVYLNIATPPPGSKSVMLFLSSKDVEQIKSARKQVETLLAGDKLVDANGDALWDDFFLSAASRPFMKNLCSEFGGFVLCDFRNHFLSVHGTEESRRNVSTAIRKFLDKERQSIGPLDAKMWRHMLTGGLEALKEEIGGEERVALDIAGRKLLIRGDRVFDTAQRFIAVTESNLATDLDPSASSAPDSDCPICLCEPTDPVTLPCGDAYCAACLKHLIVAAGENKKFPIACIAHLADHPCNTPISLRIIRKLLSEEEEERLFLIAFQTHVHRNPTLFRHCITPDCEEIYRPQAPGTIISCGSCNIKVCGSCHVASHEGLSCEDVAEENDLSQDGLDFARYKKANNIKACPNCKAPVFKDGGCNHVKCAHCDTHTCWFCMQTFVDGAGIYEHMREIHGSIGM